MNWEEVSIYLLSIKIHWKAIVFCGFLLGLGLGEGFITALTYVVGNCILGILRVTLVIFSLANLIFCAFFTILFVDIWLSPEHHKLFNHVQVMMMMNLQKI